MQRPRANPWMLVFLLLSAFVFTFGMAAGAEGGTLVEEPATLVEQSGVAGGLLVHLGCGAEHLGTPGRWTCALRIDRRYLVHGLDGELSKVAQARDFIQQQGLYGPVSAGWVQDGRLPYADNLVNLLVVSDPCGVERSEMMRVVAPGGVLVIATDGDKPEIVKKPRPAEIDEWTHYLHGPDNNAVAQDTVVGPPQHFQWIAPPRFSRSHDHLASVSTVVSAGGRIFYIVDLGSVAFAGASPRWRLVARDAFSGVELWQREISSWEYHLRDFRSGPADLARRLVAVGDRVYVTLGYDEPVVALDAATGRTVHTYENTRGTQEIVCAGGRLFLVLGRRDAHWPAQEAKKIVTQPDYSPPFERYPPPVVDKHLMAVDARSGKLLWHKTGPQTRQIMPGTLAVAHGKVFFQNTEAVVCLDGATGKTCWQTPRPCQRWRLAWSTPTLVVYQGIVYSADRAAAETEGPLLWIPSGGYHEYIRGEQVRGELIALDAQTGKRLWSCPAYEGFNAPVDVLLAGGLLWTGRYAWGNDPGITQGRDPRTGEVVRRRPSDLELLPRMGHARCHRAKATSKYLVLGRRGVEMIDVQTGHVVANRWVRGICQYGVMPANGLLYVPPHSCACVVDDLLKCGFTALAPKRPSEQPGEATSIHAAEGGVLQRGAAYEAVSESAGDSPRPASSAWPTYRHDPVRSGSTPAAVSPRLQLVWRAPLGGKLSSPVVADGLALVAGVDSHRLIALDAATGEQRWSFTAGARIDSPPTMWQGRVLFGSADGWVYCLRAADGKLAWRYRPTAAQRWIVVNGQLESAWPISGSVLVVGGKVYFVAGRTSYLDGGMYLCRLDAATGRVEKRVRLAADPKKRDGGFVTGGYLPDVLSSDGKSIFMRRIRFDLDLVEQPQPVPHLWSSVGFLDDSWWHRTYWQIGTTMGSGWGGWPRAGREVPSGRLLVTDGRRVFGYGRNQYDIPGAHVGVDAAGVWGPIAKGQGRWTYYRLFARQLGGAASASGRHRSAARRGADTSAVPAGHTRSPATSQAAVDAGRWERRVPVLVRAMVLAGDMLLLAGPDDPVTSVPHSPREVDPLVAALESAKGGRLLAVDVAGGKTLAELPLPSPPVFDGMAAAGGRVYLSAKNGELVCLGAGE